MAIIPHDSTPGPRHEVADLSFLQWLPEYEKEKPFVYLSEVPKYAVDQRQSNFKFQTKSVPITDVRPNERDFSLDEHGFAYRRHALQLQLQDFSDEKTVEAKYLPEIKNFLHNEVDGVDHVHIFDWRVRRADYTPSTMDMNDKTSFLPTSGNVHVDQSPFQVTETLNRLRNEIGPEKLDLYCQGRVRLINVWRPIAGVVEDKPVTLCDGRTYRPADLVTNDVIRSAGHGKREALALLYNPGQKFYYMSRQGVDDVLMIKIFDSTADVASACSPHTSFTHSAVPENMVPRRSIEVRAMVFTRP